MQCFRALLLGILAGCAWGASINPNAPITMNGPTGVQWTSIGNYSSPAGFMISDGRVGTQGDAFDYAGRMVVGGTPYSAPNPSDLTGSVFTGGNATLGDWVFSLQYYADPNLPVLRAIGTFTNTGSLSQSVDVTWQNNSGSDSGMQILGSSTGDASYTTADRWVVTDDSPTSGDPTQVWNLYGGGGALQPYTVSNTVFGAAGTQGVAASYNVQANAGQTVRLMWLIGMTDTGANGLTLASQLDSLNRGSSVFSGIGDAQWATIANWNPAAGGIPEPGTVVLLGTGLAVLAAARRKKQS